MTPDLIQRAAHATVGALTAMLYSSLWYARKRERDGEPFDRHKFGGTVILGAFVGFGFGLSGQPVTEETVIAAMVANTGLIALAEPLLKILFTELGVAPNYAG